MNLKIPLILVLFPMLCLAQSFEFKDNYGAIGSDDDLTQNDEEFR